MARNIRSIAGGKYKKRPNPREKGRCTIGRLDVSRNDLNEPQEFGLESAFPLDGKYTF
jgi:hypothetical protein